MPMTVEAATISIPPQDGGPEILVIYYVALKTITDDEALAQIKSIVKNEINPLFKVSAVVKADKLRRTASGKVNATVVKKNLYFIN